MEHLKYTVEIPLRDVSDIKELEPDICLARLSNEFGFTIGLETFRFRDAKTKKEGKGITTFPYDECGECPLDQDMSLRIIQHLEHATDQRMFSPLWKSMLSNLSKNVVRFRPFEREDSWADDDEDLAERDEWTEEEEQSYLSQLAYVASEPKDHRFLFQGNLVICDPVIALGERFSEEAYQWLIGKGKGGNPVPELKHFDVSSTPEALYARNVYDIDTKEILGIFSTKSHRIGIFLANELKKLNPQFLAYAVEHRDEVFLHPNFDGEAFLTLTKLPWGQEQLEIMGFGTINFSTDLEGQLEGAKL